MLRKGYGGLYKAPREEKRRSKRLRKRDQIKFIDLRFERWQIVGSGKQEEGKTFHKWHVLGMNDNL